MKKKIFLGLLLGALSFGSCVKDNESEAVKEQREAQAKFLLSEANLKDKQADVQAAEAKIKLAQADLELALKDVKVKAATATATKLESEAKEAVAKAEANVASATLEKDKIMATFAAEVEKEKAKVEGIKVQRVQNLVSAVSSATTIYGKTYSEVVQKQKDITDTEIEIAKLEAGVTSATAARDAKMAKEDDKIKRAEIKIAALEEAIKTNFGSLAELREDLSKKGYEVNNAKAARDGELKKVVAFRDDDTSEYVKAKDAVDDGAQQTSTLEFVKNLEKAYNIARDDAYNGVSAIGSVPANLSPNRKSANAHFFDGIELLESDGKRTVAGEDFNKYKAAVDTKDALLDRFFSEPHADATLDKLKLKVSDAEKEKKGATASVTLAEAAYKTAQASLTADTQSQTLIDNVQSAKEKLANAKTKEAEKEAALNKIKKKQKDFEDAVKAIKDPKNQEAVLAALKKFFTQQTELESKLDELQKLADKYNALNNEKTALEESVNAVVAAVGANTGNDGVEKLQNAIDAEKKTIATAKGDKQKYREVENAKELLEVEKKKLERYNRELKDLERKLKVAGDIYENALKALEEAMKSSSNS